MQQLARLDPLCMRWWYYKCSRTNFSATWTSQHQEAFKELHTANNLSLCATKATAQAISKTMASLVVLERHLWLNLTEIRDAEKMAFLDSVDGFAERFIL